MAMTHREVLRELARLEALPNSVDDWKDLYETLETYKQRCLARRVAASPQRDDLVAAIRELAEA
jgi:hypothetical protein